MRRQAIALLALFLIGAAPFATAQQATTEEPVKPETEAEGEAAAPANTEEAAPAETTEPVTETEPAAETEQATPEEDGQPKAELEVIERGEEPAEPREVIKESHGDWNIVCAPDGSACIMAQKGRDDENREIMEVRIRRLEERTQNNVKLVAAVQIAVPIGVMLPPGVTLQIDGSEPMPAAYRTCNPSACLVQEAVDEGLINAMKRGAKATFTLVAPPNIKIPVEISLTGFTAAYNSLEP